MIELKFVQEGFLITLYEGHMGFVVPRMGDLVVVRDLEFQLSGKVKEVIYCYSVSNKGPEVTVILESE